MNKKTLLLLLIIIFCKPQEKYELTQEEIDFENQLTKPSVFYYVVTKSGLRLREEPSLDSTIMITLPFNTPLEILAEDDKETTIDKKIGRWMKVSFRGEKNIEQVGYVFSAFISPKNQIRYYNNSKNYYYSLNYEPECSNEAFNKCSNITFYDSKDKLISNFVWNPDNVKWYDETIVSAFEANGDGGGYASSMNHFNILNSQMLNVYSIGGDFDDDSKGYRKINVSLLNKHFVFELNIISNTLTIFETDEQYKFEIKKLTIIPPKGKKIELDLEIKDFDINFEKSVLLKDKLFFSFFGKQYEIKL